MGLGGSSRTGTSRQGTNAGFSLLSALNPQLASAGGFDNETQKFLAGLDTPVGSVLQGIPGVLTFDQFGKPQPVGSNNLPTLLPGISEIGNFNTLFEKADAGSLSPSAQQLFGSFLDTATGGTDFGKLFGGLGIGGGIGGGGGVSATPPPNIGVLTSQILEDLPDEFQTFISDTLDASSPERVAQNMQEFEERISARAQQNASIIGEDLLDVFGAQGGTSGAAMAELKSLALQATVEANAQIAAGNIELLNQQIQAMQVGTNLVDVLTGLGAQEQAHLVSLELGELQANAAIQVAGINAQSNLQQTLISATAQLEAQRLNLLGQGFESLVNQSSAEESARISSLQLPYELLLGLQQQTTAKQKEGAGGLLGGIIGGLGSIGGSLLSGGASTDLGAGGVITGGASDIRLKENIRRVGLTSSGFPVYAFNFKESDQTQLGVMAQEVEKTRPDLVYEVNGIKHVNYGGI